MQINGAIISVINNSTNFKISSWDLAVQNKECLRKTERHREGYSNRLVAKLTG